VTDIAKKPLLSVNKLSVEFKLGRNKFQAVKDVSFDIFPGETFSLVGESGCGKTTIGRTIMGIHRPASGSINYEGTPISGRMSRGDQQRLRQKIQMIFQDPMASLNERAKVDYIVSEGLYNFKLYENEAERRRKVEQALAEVGLPAEFASRFPHEFSGGQRQRIGIARALVMRPKLLIADEPISALDVSIRSQILNLMNELKRTHGLTYLFVAHDLSVVKIISDRIAVIYKGSIMELAPSQDLFDNPVHPYTRALLSAIPVPDPRVQRSRKLLTYNPAMHHYGIEKPEWSEISEGHFVLASKPERAKWLNHL
jgi:ABC-type oligopeptide transport system ATPase subunit